MPQKCIPLLLIFFIVPLYATITPVEIAERFIRQKEIPQSAFDFYSTFVGLACLTANNEYDPQIVNTWMESLSKNDNKTNRYSGNNRKKTYLSFIPLLEGSTADQLLPYLSPKTLEYLFQFPHYPNHFDLYIDEILGLRSIEGYNREVNERLSGHNDPLGTWRGLNPNILNTSYNHFLSAIKELNLPEGALIAEMGCASGRLGFIIGSQFQGLQYVGYEYHLSRIEPAIYKAEKLGYDNVRYLQADFAADDFEPIIADVYFIYWSNSRENVMTRLMEKLEKIARHKKIVLLVRNQVGSLTKSLEWLGPAVNLKIPEFFFRESK